MESEIELAEALRRIVISLFALGAKFRPHSWGLVSHSKNQQDYTKYLMDAREYFKLCLNFAKLLTKFA